VTQATQQRKVPCHQLHIERAQQGFNFCVDCRRPLFRRPKEKCAKHTVWLCPECFSEDDLEALRGFAPHENEDEGED